jgi:hypothetical protein
MSTRDMYNEITLAYKKSNSTQIGHNFPVMAWATGTYSETYGSIAPECGQLLFINEVRARPTTGCEVNFTYKAAYPSGFTTAKNNLGVSYQKRVYYTGTASLTGSVYIERGTRENNQILFSDNYVYEIESLSLSDPRQEVVVYALGDDGMRLLFAQHIEKLFNIEDIYARGYFVAPAECLLCNATGVYNSGVCPDCLGFKYKDINLISGTNNVIAGWRYKQIADHARAKGITRRTESQDSFQWRAWAKHWKVIPTESEIKRYVGHFFNVDSGLVTVSKNYFPEAYFKVEVPLDETKSYILSTSGTTATELILSVVPAGVNGVFEGYYLINSGEVSAIGTGSDFTTDLDPDGWNNSSFGSEFETNFFYNTGYFQENSGIVSNAMESIFSKNIRVMFGTDYVADSPNFTTTSNLAISPYLTNIWFSKQGCYIILSGNTYGSGAKFTISPTEQNLLGPVTLLLTYIDGNLTIDSVYNYSGLSVVGTGTFIINDGITQWDYPTVTEIDIPINNTYANLSTGLLIYPLYSANGQYRFSRTGTIDTNFSGGTIALWSGNSLNINTDYFQYTTTEDFEYMIEHDSFTGSVI